MRHCIAKQLGIGCYLFISMRGVCIHLISHNIVTLIYKHRSLKHENELLMPNWLAMQRLIEVVKNLSETLSSVHGTGIAL